MFCIDYSEICVKDGRRKIIASLLSSGTPAVFPKTGEGVIHPSTNLSSADFLPGTTIIDAHTGTVYMADESMVYTKLGGN